MRPVPSVFLHLAVCLRLPSVWCNVGPYRQYPALKLFLLTPCFLTFIPLPNIKIVFSTFNKDYFRLLYKFTLPAALSTFMVMPVFWIVRTMLVNKCGFEELAIYEVADQWKVIILFIPTAISQVVLPILSGLSTDDNQKQFWKVLRINLFLNAGIALVIASIVSCCSPFIMSFYGSAYTKYSVLIVLAFSTVFSSMASIIGLSIYSRAKMWVSFAFNFLWALMLILLSLLFLHYGYRSLGVSYAILLSYIIHSINQFIYLFKIHRENTLNIRL